MTGERLAMPTFAKPMCVQRFLWSAVLFVSLSGTMAQSFAGQLQRAMLGGQAASVLHLSDSALHDAGLPPLDRAGLLELKGEEYHRLSDIGEAKRLWDEAFALRTRTFGDSSVEAAVGHAYRARYHSYMTGGGQPDHKLLAMQQARIARHLLLSRRGDVNAQERILILREHAYAFKVMSYRSSTDDPAGLNATRSSFREALGAARVASDTLWTAQVFHDIGNTFTDVAIWPEVQAAPLVLRMVVDSARYYYGASSKLLGQVGAELSEQRMMDALCTGLLYRYAYGTDSTAASVESYDQALRIVYRMAGAPVNVDPLTHVASVSNKAQVLELLFFRAYAFEVRYSTSKDVSDLREALRCLEAAVPYWEGMLRDYRSADIHKVTSSYGHHPYAVGTWLAAKLHLLTGDTALLHQSFRWSELDRNATDQRDRLQAGATTLQSSANAAELPRSLPEGKLAVAYHIYYNHLLALVIDERGRRVLDLSGDDPEALRFWVWPDSLRNAIEQDRPDRFAHWSQVFLRECVAPVLADREVKELLVVGKAELLRVPFDALVTAPVEHATWGSLPYLGNTMAVRVARSLHEGLAPLRTWRLRDAVYAAALPTEVSALPFNTALVDELARTNGTVPTHGLERSMLLELLRSDGLLHVAAHAEASALPDALPRLLLEDGPLDVAAMEGHAVNCGLLVLSSCSSGQGRYYRSEGPISLANVLLRNGAGAVVQTLWPVDDQATAEVLALMYEHLDDGETAAEALAQAKRDFVERHRNDAFANPFYWSGIVVNGGPVKPERRPGGPPLWHLGGAMIVVLAAIGYKRRKSSRARFAS